METIKTVRYENKMWEISHNSRDRKWYIATKNEHELDLSHKMYIDEAEMDELIGLLSAMRNI